MGNITVHEFMSLDGVVDTPTWTAEYGFDPSMGKDIGDMMASCEALLLGRKTFEMFAQTWPNRGADDDPGAPFFNDSPKYVVSGGAQASVEWSNSHLLGPYDAAEIRSLKDRTKGNLYVSGSITLVQALLADGLVDELHLLVYPLALGAGRKLFAEDAQTKLELLHTATYDNGVIHLVYRQTT
jgi:dihydrofolate reductase